MAFFIHDLILEYRSTGKPSILDDIRDKVAITLARAELLPLLIRATGVFDWYEMVRLQITCLKRKEPVLAKAMEDGLVKKGLLKRKYLDPRWRKATIIQRAWRRAIANPTYSLCQKRLLCEFQQL